MIGNNVAEAYCTIAMSDSDSRSVRKGPFQQAAKITTGMCQDIEDLQVQSKGRCEKNNGI